VFWEIRSAVARLRIVASDDAALFLVTQDNTKFDSYFSLPRKIHSLYWATLYIPYFSILWYFW
jgi:hypothetical protein